MSPTDTTALRTTSQPRWRRAHRAISASPTKPHHTLLVTSPPWNRSSSTAKNAPCEPRPPAPIASSPSCANGTIAMRSFSISTSSGRCACLRRREWCLRFAIVRQLQTPGPMVTTSRRCARSGTPTVSTMSGLRRRTSCVAPVRRCWLARVLGLSDSMAFTYRNPERSTEPQRSVNGAQAMVVAARSYVLDEPDAPDGPYTAVARYAWVDHYASLRQALRAVVRRLRADGWKAVAYADDNSVVGPRHGPSRGLGWFGKNANLLVPGAGSWFVLGSVVTTAPLTGRAEAGARWLWHVRRCLDWRAPPGPSSNQGSSMPPAAWPGCCRRPASFPAPIFGRRSVTGSTAATTVRGVPQRSLRRPSHRPPPPAPSARRRVPRRPPPPRWSAIPRPPPWSASASASASAPTGSRRGSRCSMLLGASDDELLAAYGRWYLADRDPRWIRRNALVVLGNIAGPSGVTGGRVLTLLPFPSRSGAACPRGVGRSRGFGSTISCPPTDLDPDVVLDELVARPARMKHLLVTNDFPPKIGGIQSLLWEWWRRLPPDSFAVLTSPYAGTAEFDAAQPFHIERTREPVLLPHPWMVRRVDAHGAARSAPTWSCSIPPLPLGLVGPSLRAAVRRGAARRRGHRARSAAGEPSRLSATCCAGPATSSPPAAIRQPRPSTPPAARCRSPSFRPASTPSGSGR